MDRNNVNRLVVVIADEKGAGIAQSFAQAAMQATSQEVIPQIIRQIQRISKQKLVMMEFVQPLAVM